jgi:CHAT domain-containing protein
MVAFLVTRARVRRSVAARTPVAAALTFLAVALAIDASAQSSVTELWQRAESQRLDGLLTQAERTLRDAASRSTSDSERATSAVRLAVVLVDAGQYEPAQRAVDEATRLRTSLSAAEQVQLAQVSGSLAARQGSYAEAERHFNDATAAAEAAGITGAAWQNPINALRARIDARELQGLDAGLARLANAAAALPSSDEAALVRIGIAQLHRRAINELRSPIALRGAAFELLDRARADAQTDPTRAQALGYLGALYEDEGRVDEALQLTQQAIFLAQAAGAHDQLYLWDWQEARLARRAGQSDESVAALDRAVSSLSFVRNDLLRSSRRAFSSVIEPIYLDYADVHLQRAAAQPEGSADQQAGLRDVRDKLESMKQAELQDYFETACVVPETDPAGGAFNTPGIAVVYPILLQDRLEVLIESQGSLRRFSAPVSRAQLTAAVRRLRVGIEQPGAGDAYREPARALHDWLFGAAQAWLSQQRVDTLVVVPSGALRTVPMAVLHDGERFLIERYALATTPSINSLGLGEQDDVEGMFAGGLSQSVQGFSELPAVTEELRNLSVAYETQPLANEGFQLEAVQRQLATGDISIAHLATHGEFSSNYRDSFILTYDDRLTMDQLQTTLLARNAPLDLLVLSACRTAAGDDRAALGLAGVAVQSGVRSALASLWYVSDTATAQLMSQFYSGLNGETPRGAASSKAQSLRDAQIQLLRSAEFSHPSYWAPYLLIGSWM